jgi:hypothetical protein
MIFLHFANDQGTFLPENSNVSFLQSNELKTQWHFGSAKAIMNLFGRRAFIVEKPYFFG